MKLSVTATEESYTEKNATGADFVVGMLND